MQEVPEGFGEKWGGEMSEKLKPCPFCGCEANDLDEVTAPKYRNPDNPLVGCLNTYCFQPSARRSIWNNRPTEKAARKEVLEMACKYLGWDGDFRRIYKEKFGDQG